MEKSMEMITLVKDGKVLDFLIEKECEEGIRDIGKIVARDVKAVCGHVPGIIERLEEGTGETTLLMATVGKSKMLETLEGQGSISLKEIRGKRECFAIQLVKPASGKSDGRQLLVIAGSDKRGTIYGMFHFSECCGVSPLVFFGDAIPARKDCVSLAVPYFSKEPSVTYRGFFINDEWPAFGNWATEQFGGINANAYEKIFELLLRMKGNYLWPAMWKSSFSEDGPGLLNAELADKYGVIMGTSHHEPMCRAGVEWQNQYRKYGEDSSWSFLSNEEAITKFWEEGLLRNLPFENVITIGMRGENDSKLLPADATMKDNVEVVKKAILAQHALIRKHAKDRFDEIPRMLAIYKEVEDYYYGDESCVGLKDWEELKDVIFLLSDDNYGNLRGLPSRDEKDHPGGFGMYYHFDYHGAPVSYEWANCNRLTKTWEQMTQAYEAGVRKMWIVNVGDLKNMEYPLSYFMNLAYDFEIWGSTAPNRTKEYALQWINVQFGDRLTKEQRTLMADVIEGYTRWNAIRSHESMKEGLFHAVHLREAERVEEEIRDLTEKTMRLKEELKEEALETYQSMIYYQAALSFNLFQIYLDAARNKELAQRGCIYANVYGEKVKRGILLDQALTKEFHQILGGKWNHCLSSAHTGFRDWDDKDWTYPTVETVMPISGGKAVISFRGSEKYHLGAHWQDQGPLQNYDFTRPDCMEVLVDLDCRGDVSYSYEVEWNSPWLLCGEPNGRVNAGGEGRVTLHFTKDVGKLNGNEKALVNIRIRFDNGMQTYSNLQFEASGNTINADEERVFLENKGYCCILAEHYNRKKDVDGKGFQVISYLGREGSALKSFPAMESYVDAASAPGVRYSVFALKEGTYDLQLWLLARNPVRKGGRMRFFVSVNEGQPTCLDAVSENYYTEWFCSEWAKGVLEHVRRVQTKVFLRQGRNDVWFYAGDPGVILEKLVLSREGLEGLESYLGPAESFELAAE